jgi:hypothetical protein
MTARILLDPEGDLPAPQGVQVIESEVEFLRHAVSGQVLLIRGARLCQWAQDFYALRGVPTEIIESPRAALQRNFSLSSEQARELAERIGREYLSSQELSAVFILNTCFPADGNLWQDRPSPQHSARWLLWLLEHTPSEAEAVILKKFASEVEMRAGESSIRELYRATDATQAETLLLRWLGAEKGAAHAWGEFPLELPARWLNAVREAWMKRIIATNGAFFAEMLPFPLPLNLRQELARQTADYYRQHSHELTLAALRQLQRYLDPSNLVALEEHLPPPVPAAPPEDESDVLGWFECEYLPYRRWQARFGDETARQTVVEHAQAFARWLLERYPRWLLDGEHLVFQKSARLTDSNTLILCVILDGLPAWDAEWLAQELSARVPRLTLLQKTYCFTALPTVTEFAKEALLKGVPPLYAPQTPALGKILPDNLSPKKHLQQAAAGQVWFWRVEQPDSTYHFESEEKRDRQIRAQLQSIAQEIGEVVQVIPTGLPLNILITSDHGRLLNPRSPRQLAVEAGLQAHGRVAWGSFQRSFPETGFYIDEKNGWVELYGERFGMAHNLRLAWGEASFAHTNGTEAYPHGGLFPEEVIVPWFVYQRDAQPVRLEIAISGAGEAEMSGEVSVSILNKSPLALECRQIRFSHDSKIDCNWHIPPLSERQFHESLTPWPPKSAEGKITASLSFVQPNGATFIKETSANLQIKVLYDRSDDLLKDLDL